MPGYLVAMLICLTVVPLGAKQFVGSFLLVSLGFSETYQVEPGVPDWAAIRYMCPGQLGPSLGCKLCSANAYCSAIA